MLALIVVLTALAGVANYQAWAAVPRFAIATLALAGLAWVVSFATEQLGERFGPGVTGMLQSTLGNLPELFVVIFALQKGELVVAQTAIVGSILANALLVLGLVLVVGARRSPDGIMRFSKRLPRDTATLLQVAVFIIVLLGLSLAAHDPASHHVQVDLDRRRDLPARRLPRLGRALSALRHGAGGEAGCARGRRGRRGEVARRPGRAARRGCRWR